MCAFHSLVAVDLAGGLHGPRPADIVTNDAIDGTVIRGIFFQTDGMTSHSEVEQFSSQDVRFVAAEDLNFDGFPEILAYLEANSEVVFYTQNGALTASFVLCGVAETFSGVEQEKSPS